MAWSNALDAPPRLPHRRKFLALVLTACCLGILAGVLMHASARSGYASESTPPGPPTFVPTPVGSPPGPPTSTVTVTPTLSSTPVPSGTITGTDTPTPTSTPKPVARLAFSLDAARVSKINNPGNLIGLASVKRGTHVWLMMYFTVEQLPKALERITTYQILSGKKTVYEMVYKTKAKVSEVGRYSRYSDYTVPATLPFGKYTFRATLSIGNKSRRKSWEFRVGREVKVSKKSAGA